MTSDHVLAVMALMREVETPAKSYRHSVRRAAATATDSPQNEAARAQGERALRDIEQAVRLWVATHPEKSEPAEPSEWVDGDPLLEAIAGALKVADYELPVEQRHDLAVAVAGPARAAMGAGLSPAKRAVLPQKGEAMTTDHEGTLDTGLQALSAVLRYAAERTDREDLPQTAGDTADFHDGARWATARLREIADEAGRTPGDFCDERLADLIRAVREAVQREALNEAANRINALPQDYEKDPGRGESADNLRQWVCKRCKGSGEDPERMAEKTYGDVVDEPEPCSACQFVGRGL